MQSMAGTGTHGPAVGTQTAAGLSRRIPVTPDAPTRRPGGPVSSLYGELAADHHVIRDLVDRLEHQTEDWMDEVEELSNLLARHRSTGMESVISRSRTADHQQQVRLLLSAMRGMDQLTDRLRLPARDPLLLRNILVALRGLEHEHERLETELLSAELDRVATDAGNAPLV